MGFFGALGKVIAGKPVYEPTSQNKQPPAGSQPAPVPDGDQSASAPSQPVAKVVPVVLFDRVECRVDGQRLDVYADVRNNSSVPVFLDCVTLCDAKRQLDTRLAPGEVRQLPVYSGQLMANQPGGYATVQYRTTQDGDYFIDYHEVRSEQDGAMGYRITELLQRGPVKDI